MPPNGYPLARATVRQRKTGRPVRFELTEQTRQAVDDYLKAIGKVPGEFLFTSPAVEELHVVDRALGRQGVDRDAASFSVRTTTSVSRRLDGSPRGKWSRLADTRTPYLAEWQWANRMFSDVRHLIFAVAYDL